MKKIDKIKLTNIKHLIGAIYKDILHSCSSARNSNVRCVSLSIYERTSNSKKNSSFKNLYTVLQSTTLYATKSQNFKISNDDFSGYIFHKLQGSRSGEDVNDKNFRYLKLFFEDIDFLDDFNNKFYKFKLDKDKKIFLQIIVLYRSDPIKSDEKKIEKMVKKFKAKYKYDKEIKLPATRHIKNSSVIIIDLIRNATRKQYPELKYADASITKKMISTLAKIITNYGFYIASHTGDGYIFFCEKATTKKLILQEAKAIMQDIENYLDEISPFLKETNNYLLDYKLRILIDKIESVFEINNDGKMSSKLYFSPDLDIKFDKMKHTAKHSEKHLLITGDIYDNIEWSSPIFEIKRER